jgi:hypothetical protein
MPTSASRRVWEGKAGNYNRKALSRQSAAAPEGAWNADTGKGHDKKTTISLALHEILYKNTVCSYNRAPHPC